MRRGRMGKDMDYDPFNGFTTAAPKSAPTSGKVGLSTSTKPVTSGATPDGAQPDKVKKRVKRSEKNQKTVSGQWVVFNAAQANVGSTPAPEQGKAGRKRPREDEPVEDPSAASDLSPDDWRAKHNITFDGNDCPAPMTSFACLPNIAKGHVRKAFAAQGFTAPTPIQAQSWPIVFSGRDMVGIAKTGSGKTLSFMIPAIARVEASAPLRPGDGPLVCVLAPTRELAQQIVEETNKVLPESIGAACIYGGAPKGPQLKELSMGCHILVGTPGRVSDFLEGKKLSLSRVTYLVLDEADRMLDMGFEPQVKDICRFIPKERQTLMFSATWPKEVQSLAKAFQNDIIRINIGSTKLFANSDITQQFVFAADEHAKVPELRKIISCRPTNRILVFVNMKSTADSLDQQLRKTGIECQSIHGDKDQSQREYILYRFKKQTSGVLIATDVAARGLDIKQLECVVNFDFPGSVDDYVHRIGRTGRAGCKGLAVTIIGPRDKNFNGAAAKRMVELLETASQVVPPQIKEKSMFADFGNKSGAPMLRNAHGIVKYRHTSTPGGGGVAGGAKAEKSAAVKKAPPKLFGLDFSE